LKEWGLRASIFINPEVRQAEAAAQVGADRVELYTEPYAILYPSDPLAAITPYVEAAQAAKSLGLGLNAGHDLSLENLSYFIRQIPDTDEVSIGHCLICDALYMGIETAIKAYKKCLIYQYPSDGNKK
jgi:pyridoxine 5-phosphate synthase